MNNFIDKIEAIISNVEARPFDRYVLGPFLIWYGLRSKKMPKLSRKLIVTAGVYQLFYNWNRYRRLQKTLAEPEQLTTILTKKFKVVA